MFCSFIMTTGKEHDNLCRRVCLPSASNYRRMRGARAGFVLKVNILYTQPYPALERFLLSTKWTSGYVSSDVCARAGEAHSHKHARTQRHTLNGCPHPPAHTQLFIPTHTLTCRRPWLSESATLFSCFQPTCRFLWGIRHPFWLFSRYVSSANASPHQFIFLPPINVTYTQAN